MTQFFCKNKMLLNFGYAIAAISLLFIFVNCTSQNRMIDPSIQNTLKEYKSSSESAGILIYEGSVFPLGLPEAEQAFSYERRIKETTGVSTATHITRDAGKNVVVIQSAKYSMNYSFREFESINGQTGIRTKVEQNGKLLKYKVTERNGKISTVEEEVNEPIAVGPTLFGLISSQWEELAKGSSFYLRFVVAEMKQSYRFEVRKVESTNTITRFEMKPTNLIIGLFISTFIFDYDSSQKTIITYTGRVPPRRTIDGKLKELDARVLYTHHTAYR